MKFIIDKNRYILFNEKTNEATVVVISEIAEKLEVAQDRINKIPTEPTIDELLSFARENYPTMDYSAEKASLQKTIQECTSLLEAK